MPDHCCGNYILHPILYVQNAPVMNTRIPLLYAALPLWALLSFGAIRAQDIKWPARYNFHNRGGSNIAYTRQGYLVLVNNNATANNDTVRGFIRLYDPSMSTFAVMDTATHSIREFSFNEIEVMRLYLGSTDGPYTDWIHLSYSGKFWQLMARKNDVAIYETMPWFGGKPFLFTPEKRIKLVRMMPFLLHNDTGYEASLIRFIHRRYKTKVNDFHSTEDIYRYIVEKENERMENHPPSHPRP
jgi:hypothetical protein